MELVERVQELRKDIELGLKTDVVEISVELIKIETELKQLLIQRVSQQREQFINFYNWIDNNINEEDSTLNEDRVDRFISEEVN